ncbi:hypothetical protein EJ05DRAFT_481340 [Pseudovirgaria hyperparasitica]|uniref:Uncharacterized protein n=1 Tax=Pseudovirgaria hyperparasitica TaxID=470096 RepID=A0A6A6WJG6_9PEZI|nr:uncharacterized protein EJ05DRAFT_481340 [Pseudovirgaria hyperparasitica]KAF2762394.1 hypothetical protein EJ05DRAFT_481340 [Pseudovirgaria hyperparasitica]
MPSLASLPVEIRLAIFHYVLLPSTDDMYSRPPSCPATVIIHPADVNTPSDHPRRFWGSSDMSSLLLLCRLIHTDIHMLIYASSTFVLAPQSTAVTPLTPTPSLVAPAYTGRLSPSLRDTIRHLDVRIPLYIRSIRNDALKLCIEAHETLFPGLRSVVLRILHISFASNPLGKYRESVIIPLLSAFRGVDTVYLHCHETRFFGWGAGTRSSINHPPPASASTQSSGGDCNVHPKVKFDVVESWQAFVRLPGGAMLYRSSAGKTSPKFETLCDEIVWQRTHGRSRPSVLAIEGMNERECPGVEVAFRSAQTDRAMDAVGDRRRGRRVIRF